MSFAQVYLQGEKGMEFTQFLNEIFQLCLVPLLAIIAKYLIAFLNVKANEAIDKIEDERADKYIAMLNDTVAEAVLTVNQTYVEALKDKDVFDKAAQEEAFNKAFESVMAVLSDDAKDYLVNIYGDLTICITQKIEAEVNASKPLK